MTSSPSRYAVDRSVDPKQSPPSYGAPKDEIDSPYSVDNHVQSRNSASYKPGNLFVLFLSEQ